MMEKKMSTLPEVKNLPNVAVCAVCPTVAQIHRTVCVTPGLQIAPAKDTVVRHGLSLPFCFGS